MTLENATLANISFSDTKLKIRRGTAAEWAAANPVLAEGEPGYESDTGILKIGDGATAYNSLNPRIGNYASTFTDGATVDTLLETVNGSNLSATHKITRSATLVIAASDSSAKSKAQADYVCDGVGDEVEILNAIDDIGTGTVYFTSGTFVCSGLPIKTGLSYRGAGDSSTVLKLPTGATNGMFVTSGAEAINGGGIYDLAIDGSNAPTFNGIDFGASTQLSEFHIERCYIHNLNHGYHGSLDDRFCPIVDCKIYNNDVGVYVENNHPRLTGCDIRANTVGLGGKPYDLTAESTRFNYNMYGVRGTAIGDVEACFFNGCSFYNNTEVGLDVGSRCIVVGCLFGGTQNNSLTISGIYTSVTGCNFRCEGAGTVIVFSDGASCTGTLISSNVIDNLHGDAIIAGNGTGARERIVITDNVIRVSGRAINFPNVDASSPFLYGIISSNSISVSGDIGTDAVINVPNTLSGCLITNNVLYGQSGVVCGYGIDVDARSAIVSGNRIRRTLGINTSQTDGDTIATGNIVT